VSVKTEVVAAAIKWWKSHRPVGWTENQHLENPTVNAGYRDSAGDLAEAVAGYLLEKRLTKQ
jgi:hypothetical protein